MGQCMEHCTLLPRCAGTARAALGTAAFKTGLDKFMKIFVAAENQRLRYKFRRPESPEQWQRQRPSRAHQRAGGGGRGAGVGLVLGH